MNRWLCTPQGPRGLVKPVRHAIAVAIALSATLLPSACASPVEGLRPPSPDSPARTIFVSLDTWHAMIAFSESEQPAASNKQEEPQARSSSPPIDQLSAIRHSLLEEWGYAERAWYLEDKRGLTGIARALFWPTEGVVEVGRYDRVWADRTPQPPSELFVFRVSDESYRRVRRHLSGTVSVDVPIGSVGQSTFYPAVRSYHLFHTCHQYAAHALREAGLPISAFWAFNRTSLAWQLRRAARIAARSTEAPLGESRYTTVTRHVEQKMCRSLFCGTGPEPRPAGRQPSRPTLMKAGRHR